MTYLQHLKKASKIQFWGLLTILIIATIYVLLLLFVWIVSTVFAIFNLQEGFFIATTWLKNEFYHISLPNDLENG